MKVSAGIFSEEKFLRKKYSPKQLKAWRLTERVLMEKAAAAGFQGPDWDLWKQFEKRLTQHEYMTALHTARQKFPDTPEGEQIIIAESIMVRKGFVPLDWTGYVSCESCGDVPFTHEYRGENFSVCPWCDWRGKRNEC